MRSLIVLGISLSTAWLSAGTITAEAATVAASADTYITEHVALGRNDANHGSDADSLYVIGMMGYRAWPMVKFDVAAYSGWVFDSPSASIRMHITAIYPYFTSVSQTIELHAIAVPWLEHTVSLTSFGLPTVGSNMGPVLDTRVLSGVGVGDDVTWTIPSSLIQSWIDDPSTNYGLILVSLTQPGGQDIQFGSREGSFPATLTFEAELPGDVDGNGHVDVTDLLFLVDAFGSVNGDPSYNAACDFNHDDSVDVVDLLDLVLNFGR